MPVIVVPTGFKKISDPPTEDTQRRTTITTGIYAPPDHDHIVRSLHHISNVFIILRAMCVYIYIYININLYVQALALAMAYQSVTDHHKQRPPIDNLGPNDTVPNPPTKTVPPRQLRG